MNKAVLVLSTIVLILGTGCSRSYWKPPEGADQQTYYRDQADCKQQAAASAYGVAGYMRDHVRNDTYSMCLRGRGWDKVRKPKS